VNKTLSILLSSFKNQLETLPMNISFITDTPHTATYFAEFFHALPHPKNPQRVQSFYERLYSEKKPTPIKKERIHILATGEAAVVFVSKNIFFYEFNQQKINLYSPSQERETLIQEIAKTLSSHTHVVFTGVASSFDIEIHKALATYAPHVKRISFYDSPDEYLPGYSEMAAQVMNVSERILFANIDFVSYKTLDHPIVVATLPRISEQEANTASQQFSSLGYVHTDAASMLAKKRKSSHLHAHQMIVEKLGLYSCFHQEKNAIGTQYTILPYLPEKTEYQQQKFESFLTLLKQASAEKDLSHLLILVQAITPFAKMIETAIASWKDKDNSQLPLILVSPFNLEFSLIAADGLLYHSSPFAHQVALAGISTIQIGSDTISDILVKKGIGSKATSGPEFIQCLNLKNTCGEMQILNDLGFSLFWAESLASSLHRLYQ
jgi:hypothetical protein